MRAVWPRERGEADAGPRVVSGPGRCRVEPLEGRALFSGNPFELDPTFGAGGFVSADLAHLGDFAAAVEVQPDGKVLVAGYTAQPENQAHNFAGLLARFNADGSLDTTFGDGGVAVTQLADRLTSLAVLANGQIVAGGEYWGGFGHGDDSALLRFNADGSPDLSFGGGDGVEYVNLASWGETFNRIAIAPDGKIVGLSQCANFDGGFDQGDFGVVRFNANGTLDATFGGGDGVVTTDFSDAQHSLDLAAAVGFTADGKLVVAGSTTDQGGTGIQPRDGGFGLARYNDDGSLDTSFGDGGKVITPFADGDLNDWVTWGRGDAHDLIVRADGTVLVAGVTSQYGLTLARYAADGSLDAVFGALSPAAGEGGVGPAAGQSMRLAESADGDGSVVVAGTNFGSLFAAHFAADGRLISHATAALPSPNTRTLSATAFQADGRVVFVGQGAATAMPIPLDHDEVTRWQNTHDLLIARYTAPASAVVLPPPGEFATVPADEPGDAEQQSSSSEDRPVPDPAPAAAVPLPASSPAVDLAVRTKATVRAGKASTFTVTYTAGAAIDLQSVRDVRVSGPNSFSAAAEVRKVKANKAGTRVVATYRLAAAGGAWDAGDNGQYTVALVAPSGTGEAVRTLGGFSVDSKRSAPTGLRRLKGLRLGDAMDPTSQAGDVSAEMNGVFAWCDHMPIVDDGPANDRQYLTAAVMLTNTGSEARTVTLDGALLRFDGETKWVMTAGISLRGDDGRPTGGRTVVLQPGETRQVEFRGDRLFAEGNHDRTLNVTLVFSTPDGATLHVGGSSVVTMTS